MEEVRRLLMNLQFFSDGDADGGEEEAEPADQPEETEDAEIEEEPEDEEPEEEPEDEDRDSIYAAARRRAESEAKAKYAREQQERDSFYARMCEGKVNPETHQPIRSEAEYREAMAAQERVKMSQQLSQAGIDPNVINQMIAANPAIREAERLVAENRDAQIQQMVSEDIRNIMSLDKSFATEEDLTNSEEFKKAIDYCRTRPGVRVSEAYRIVNFDNLRDVSRRAAKQAAINEAKGKGHMRTAPKTPTGKGSIEIPESELSRWQRFFPDKTPKQLNALYAKSHK